MTAYAKIPGTTWFVVSTIAEKKLTAEAQAVRNQIALVGISGVLLSIFLAYFISHSISAPLRELVRKVHDTGDDAGAQVDEGKRVEAGARAQDELSRLAQRFERMREAIKQKIQKINEINASLEQTVVERTAELVTRERESRTLIENSPDTIARYDRESAASTPTLRSVPWLVAALWKRWASGPRNSPAAKTRASTKRSSATSFQAAQARNSN